MKVRPRSSSIASSSEKIFFNNEIRPPKFVLNSNVERWQHSFDRFLATGHLLLLLPLEYKKASQTVKISSTCRLIIWYSVLFCYGLDLCYLTYASGQVNLDNTQEKEYLDFYIHTSSRFIAWLIQLAIVLHLKELIQFLNCLFGMRRKWQGLYRGFLPCNYKSTQITEQKMGTIAVIFTGFVHIQPMMPLILHLDNRQSLRYWPSKYLPKEVYNSIPFAFLYAMNDLAYSYYAIFGSAYVIGIVISFMALTSIWLTVLKERVHMGLSFSKAYFLYKEQLVFNRIANSCFDGFIIPVFVGGSLVLLILMPSSLIRNARVLPLGILVNLLFGSLLILASLHYLLGIGGEIWKKSGKLKNLFVRKYGEMEKRLFITGLMDLRIYVRDIFFLQTMTFFQFCEIVMTQMVNYLLATTSTR